MFGVKTVSDTHKTNRKSKEIEIKLYRCKEKEVEHFDDWLFYHREATKANACTATVILCHRFIVKVSLHFD